MPFVKVLSRDFRRSNGHAPSHQQTFMCMLKAAADETFMHMRACQGAQTYVVWDNIAAGI